MKVSVAFSFCVLILFGCVSSPTLPPATPFPTSAVALTGLPAGSNIIFPATEYVPSPTATAFPYHGYLQFTFLNADAGNFQLQTGATITFTWTDAPLEAELYEFVIYPLDGSQSIIIGTDTDSSDGVAFEWVVAPDIAAELRGFAHYADGKPAQVTSSSTIYSAPSP